MLRKFPVRQLLLRVHRQLPVQGLESLGPTSHRSVVAVASAEVLSVAAVISHFALSPFRGAVFYLHLQFQFFQTRLR